MNGHKNPERGAEFIVGAVEHTGIAVEGDSAFEFADGGSDERAEFVGEQ